MNSAEVQLPSQELLELLGDAELHSGQELASLLGVSRTAIWKQLAKLEALGLALESRPGKGYRLSKPLCLLNEASLRAGLTQACAARVGSIALPRVIDSTNAYLLRQAPDARIQVCIAEMQTAGRGRRGRQWVSPFAANIYMSLKMTIESGVAALEGLSLAVGVAVVRALDEQGAVNVQLKWPNDVLWRGRKLGGILIELTGEPSGICHIVVGLGLNVCTSEAMKDLIDQPFCALEDILDRLPDRNLMVASLLNHLTAVLERYEVDGFANYKAAWEALNAHADQRVCVQMGTVAAEGVMRGLNATGALLLETEKGLEIFHGGEVSLRGMQ